MTSVGASSDKIEKAEEILHEFYQMIDETFLSYIIALEAPHVWRRHLERYEDGYRKCLHEDGYEDVEIETHLDQQDHFIPPDGEFKIRVNTKNVRKVLVPGVFENLQAKNVIKILYDAWDRPYRDGLEKLVGEKIRSAIWGDLGWIRQSIVHRNSRGIDKLKKAKLITDFKPGQEIIFTPGIMEKIRQELENWYTEFLMKYFSPGQTK